MPAPDPFVELSRADWSRLSLATPLPLTEGDVARLRGLCDPITLAEVDAIFRPISRLLNLYISATSALNMATSAFLGEHIPRTPYVIGITGSVAVGKSTVARVLREMIARWPETPRVQLVTSDAFLYPNAELERRGLMNRKGFPETYDRAALLSFVERVKANEPQVAAPVYSHVVYDIVPDQQTVVHHPDVLIIEGLNILQPTESSAGDSTSVSVSDFIDFSIYVDAKSTDIEKWYVDRFLALRRTAFSRPDSYFRKFADLTDDEAVAQATSVWRQINEPNLIENILPTKMRADLILMEDSQHNVTQVRLRKL